MQLEHNAILLYNIYSHWNEIDIKTKGNMPNFNKSRLISIRSEYQSKIDKYDYYMNSSKTTAAEKDKYVEKIKPLFREVCNNKKRYPDIICAKSFNKLLALMNLVAYIEAEKIEQIQKKLGVDIFLDEIFKEERFRKELFSIPIRTLINNSINYSNYTFLGENSTVYISDNGNKYHKKDCPYCKGRVLYPVLMSDRKLKSLSPCICVTKEKRESGIEKMQKPVQEYVSVFVDESVKTKPWEAFCKDYSENHGLFSYIICRGLLTNENQIGEENILVKKVTPITSAKGPNTVTKHAIGEILFWLLSNGYTENITIYTDNENAKDTWMNMPENKHLSQYFKSITVCYIPRELNTKADELGRKEEVYLIPKKVKDSLVMKWRKYDEIRNFIINSP